MTAYCPFQVSLHKRNIKAGLSNDTLPSKRTPMASARTKKWEYEREAYRRAVEGSPWAWVLAYNEDCLPIGIDS